MGCYCKTLLMYVFEILSVVCILLLFIPGYYLKLDFFFWNQICISEHFYSGNYC